MRELVLPTLALTSLIACGSSSSSGQEPGHGPDAGLQADAGAVAVTPPATRTLYPFDRRHSPITEDIAQYLFSIDRAHAAAGAERAFMKVGDSMSHSPDFLRCFDGGTVDLGERGGLASTIEYFMEGNADGASPYARASESAFNGANGELMLAGAPSPLDRELAAYPARFGVVMLGTNDVRRGRPLDAFARELWTIADRLLDAGRIPLISTIPPNTGDAWADAAIPRFNLAIRGIAQGRQVPFVDLHRAVGALPNRGMGDDGMHLSVDPTGACVWSATGLEHGYNTRNLVTIEMLNRARTAITGVASDTAADVLVGSGRASDPYTAPWPFADIGDTRTGEASTAQHGCSSGRDLPGKEVVYQIDLPAQVRLHAQVITRDTTDVDVSVIAGGSCRASGDHEANVTVGPGPVTIVVDTPSTAAEGEFLLVAGPRIVNPM